MSGSVIPPSKAKPSYEEARIAEFLNQQIADLDGKVNVSFEFFPPNTPEMQNTLCRVSKSLSL